MFVTGCKDIVEKYPQILFTDNDGAKKIATRKKLSRLQQIRAPDLRACSAYSQLCSINTVMELSVNWDKRFEYKLTL